jgi:thioredoxin-dependent peroxiredoxin
LTGGAAHGYFPGKENSMAKITVKGNPTNTSGELPKIGSVAPDFTLVKADLSDVSLASFAGKKKILNIVTSLDTGTCATSARKFNEKIRSRTDAVVLTISEDLPFAQDRFCKAEKIDNVVTLSDMRRKDFGRRYGVEIVDGPLAGLTARAIVVLDAGNKVVYNQQVTENSQEPDYDKALAALK